MKPLAWSYSALNMFTTCPVQYKEVKVTKSVQDSKGDAAKFGDYVHKQFELRQKNKTKLPSDLAHHELGMQELAVLPGDKFFECRLALNKSLQPVQFFAGDVWSRAIIDFLAVHRNVAYIVDYKTSKRVPDEKQLALCALHIFAQYPLVSECMTHYYMVKFKMSEQPGWKVFRRTEIPALWTKFTPDLRQYVEAFKTDTWQARPSGLCAGWCPVTTCQHWRPKRDGS